MHVDYAVEESQVEPRHKVRSRRWLWVVVLLPFLVLAIYRARQGSGLVDDDIGQYLMHANALVQGRAYTDIPYIFTPRNHWIGPRAAPPGLPVTLAIIIKIFGQNQIAMKAAMLLFASAFLLIAGKYFAREDDERIGLAVAVLSGLSPLVVRGASQMLTDLPFAALIWSVIYLLDTKERMSWWQVAAVTILGGCSLAFRAAGLVLVPALLVYAAFNYKKQGVRPIVPVAAWFVCLLMLATRAGAGGTAVLVIHPERILNWMAFTHFGLRNIQPYVFSSLEGLLYPLPGRGSDVYHVLAGGVMALGLVLWLRRSIRQFAGLFFLIYTSLLLIVPVMQARYLWVLFPIFVYGLLNGFAWLGGLLTRRPRRIDFAVVFTLLLLPLGIARVVAQPPQQSLMEAPEVREVVAYMDQVRKTAKPRVTFYKPRTFAYATGIPTMGPIAAPKPCLLAELVDKRITHVIFGRLRERGDDVGTYGLLADARPDLFTRDFQNKRFTIFSFNSAKAPPLDELVKECDAVRRR